MRAATRDNLTLALWTLVVAVLLLVPGGLVREGPDLLVELAEAGVDKLVHAALFFVQALLAARALSGRGWGVWRAALLAAAYGLALELLQSTVPGRGVEAGDVAANAVGAFLWPLVSRALGRRG